MNKDRVSFYGYPTTSNYSAFVRDMRAFYGCADCKDFNNNGCGVWQLGGWEFNEIGVNDETGEEEYGKPERVEGWFCTKLIEGNKEMNANEIYQEALNAYKLASSGKLDSDAVATALLEMSKAGALVSIADSLREMVAIQRGNEEPAGVE